MKTLDRFRHCPPAIQGYVAPNTTPPLPAQDALTPTPSSVPQRAATLQATIPSCSPGAALRAGAYALLGTALLRNHFALASPITPRDICGGPYSLINVWVTTQNQPWSDGANPLSVLALGVPSYSREANVALPGTTPQGAAFSPDGRRLYVGTDAPNQALVAIDTVPFGETFGEVVKTIDLNKDGTACKQLLASGVFIGPRADVAFVIDRTTMPQALAAVDIREGSPTENQVIHLACNLNLNDAAAFTPDGLELWIPGYNDPTGEAQISVFNADVTSPSFMAMATVPMESGFIPQGIAISTDGRHAYVASESGNTLRIFDVATRSRIPGKGGDGHFPDNVVTSADGCRAAADNVLRYHDGHPNTHLKGRDGHFPNNVVTTSDGRVYMATADNVLRYYDGHPNIYLDEFKGDPVERSGHNLAVSHDGTLLFSAGIQPGNPLMVLDITTTPPKQVASVYEEANRGFINPVVQPDPTTVTHAVVSIIKALQAAGRLDDSVRATQLVTQVQAALVQSKADQRSYACASLASFRHNVQSLVNDGKLSAAAGQQLRESAQYLLSQV